MIVAAVVADIFFGAAVVSDCQTWVKFLSLHIVHKNGHLFAEVETVL